MGEGLVFFPTSLFPAKAGTQTVTHRSESIIWIPAFAGNAADSIVGASPSPNPLPQGGEGFLILSPLPEGEGWVRALFYRLTPPQQPRYSGGQIVIMVQDLIGPQLRRRDLCIAKAEHHHGRASIAGGLDVSGAVPDH